MASFDRTGILGRCFSTWGATVGVCLLLADKVRSLQGFEVKVEGYMTPSSETEDSGGAPAFRLSFRLDSSVGWSRCSEDDPNRETLAKARRKPEPNIELAVENGHRWL